MINFISFFVKKNCLNLAILALKLAALQLFNTYVASRSKAARTRSESPPPVGAKYRGWLQIRGAKCLNALFGNVLNIILLAFYLSLINHHNSVVVCVSGLWTHSTDTSWKWNFWYKISINFLNKSLKNPDNDPEKNL